MFIDEQSLYSVTIGFIGFCFICWFSFKYYKTTILEYCKRIEWWEFLSQMFIIGRNLIMKNEVVSNSTLLCDLNNKHTHEVKINMFQE